MRSPEARPHRPSVPSLARTLSSSSVTSHTSFTSINSTTSFPVDVQVFQVGSSKDAKATVIQRLWRFYRARVVCLRRFYDRQDTYRLAEERELRDYAAVRIQAQFRRFLAVQRLVTAFGTYHPLQPYAHADVPMSDLTEIITPRKVQRDRDTFGDPRPSTQAQDRTLSAILEPSPPIARYSSGHDHFVHQSLTQHALSPAREGHKSEFGVSELLRRLQLQEAEANQLRQQLRRAEAEIDQLYTEAEEVIQENSSLRSDAELRERELRALRESCQELQREKREKPPLARQSNGQVTTDFLVAYVLGSLRSLVLPPNLTSGHPNLDPNDCAPSLEALEEELNRIRRAFGYLLLCTQSGGPVEYAESNASVFADTNSLPRDADSAAASPALRHRSDSPDVNNQLKSLYADSVHLRETDRRHVVTKYFQDEHPLREITIRLTERFTDASDSGSERGVTPVENP